MYRAVRAWDDIGPARGGRTVHLSVVVALGLPQHDAPNRFALVNFRGFGDERAVAMAGRGNAEDDIGKAQITSLEHILDDLTSDEATMNRLCQVL